MVFFFVVFCLNDKFYLFFFFCGRKGSGVIVEESLGKWLFKVVE